MKFFELLKTRIYKLNKKDIFLIGFYASFLFIMSLAATIDFYIDNLIDAYIEVFFVLLTLLSMGYYKYSKNIDIAVYGIVVIATLTTYSLLISNDFNISIFHSIVPLGYFLLFSLKRSLLYTFIHQSIVIGIYVSAYNLYPDNETLHNTPIHVATVMASLMIIFFGIVYHIAVENSYQKLRQADKQKELLLKEVHHRVKNNLNIISSMLGLQLLRETDENIKHVFEKNRLRIDSIAMVHEILYKHSDFEKINIYEYLQQLSSILVDISEDETSVQIKDAELYLPFETVLEIGIITNELIINSMKYAFNTNHRKIEIKFEVDKDSYVYKYQDANTDAVDTKQLLKSKTLGFKLINMMVEQMEAEMDITSDSGLVYTIRIPKDVL